METAIKISVIIPCYNMQDYLERCVTSVVRQTIGLDALQIILVDDASTDGTWEEMGRWEQRYPESVVIIRCEDNMRQGGARNIALQYAQGEYISYVDADDWIEPDMYRAMYERARELDCDVVQCIITETGEFGYYQPGEIRSGEEDIFTSIDSDEERKNLIVTGILSGYVCNKIYRRTLLEQCGLLFPEHIAYEDVCFLGLLNLYATRIYLMQSRYYHYYRKKEDNSWKEREGVRQDLLEANLLKWEEYKRRGALDRYREALNYEFTVKYFCAGICVLEQECKDFPYETYRRMREETNARVGYFTHNYYYWRLSELHRYLVQLLPRELTETQWKIFLDTVRAEAGGPGSIG